MATTVQVEPAKATINNQEEVITTTNAVETASEEPKEEVPEILVESEVNEAVEEVKLVAESKDVGQRNEKIATTRVPELVTKDLAKVASKVKKKSTEEEEEEEEPVTEETAKVEVEVENEEIKVSVPKPEPEPEPEMVVEVSKMEVEAKKKLVETEGKIGKEVPQVIA